MADLLFTKEQGVFSAIFNRIDKSNAFDNQMLEELQGKLNEAIASPEIKVVLLKANGKHFSTGADAAWMQRMVGFTEAENIQDAQVLAHFLRTLYCCPKPTIAAVQGAAFGGGAGLVAACDIAIAAHSARFCFSEVKLGLIPATISPYVVRAVGERLAKYLFMSAEEFGADVALRYNLVQLCVEDENLEQTAMDYALKIARNAPQAVKSCKSLVNQVTNHPIDAHLIWQTVLAIAAKRVSPEGQKGLKAFLNKETPQWD